MTDDYCAMGYHQWVVDVNGDVICGNCGKRPSERFKHRVKQFIESEHLEDFDHDVDKGEG